MHSNRQPTFGRKLGKRKEGKLERGKTNLSLSCCRRISGLNLRRMCKTRVAPADAYINKKKEAKGKRKTGGCLLISCGLDIGKRPRECIFGADANSKKENDWEYRNCLVARTHAHTTPSVHVSSGRITTTTT